MRITRDIVLHTAELARLDLSELSEAEMDELTGQLDAILSHFEELDELDTAEVDPTTHAVPLPIPLRPDEPVEGLGRDGVLANAPVADDGFFVVPRVIDE